MGGEWGRGGEWEQGGGGGEALGPATSEKEFERSLPGPVNFPPGLRGRGSSMQ